MKNVAALIAVAGAAAAATAQLTVDVTTDKSEVEFGETFNVTVSVSGVPTRTETSTVTIPGVGTFTVTTTISTLLTYALEVAISGPATAGTADATVLPGGDGFSEFFSPTGAASLASLTNPYEGFDGDLFTFTLTAGDTAGTVELDAVFNDFGAPDQLQFALAGGTQDGSVPNPIDLTSTATFNGASVIVTPTPGAAAVLGLGGLVAARRRR